MRIALPLLVVLATASAASAQTPQAGQSSLEGILRPGRTVWITDARGQEERARIVGVSGGVVTAAGDEGTRRLAAADIVRVRARQSDSLWNGALVGAGAAIGSGLFLCTRTESWEICRDDVGPMIRIGALGAAIGVGVDALIRGRRTIYEAPARTARLQVAPIVARRTGGVQVVLRF